MYHQRHADLSSYVETQTLMQKQGLEKCLLGNPCIFVFCLERVPLATPRLHAQLHPAGGKLGLHSIPLKNYQETLGHLNLPETDSSL